MLNTSQANTYFLLSDYYKNTIPTAEKYGDSKVHSLRRHKTTIKKFCRFLKKKSAELINRAIQQGMIEE